MSLVRLILCVALRKIKTSFDVVQNGGKKFVFAPCGVCEDCQNTKRYAWAWRLTSDLQYYVKQRGYKVGFITLTYDDDNLPRFPAKYGALSGMSCFDKEDTNKLILYLRKTLHRDYGIKEFLYFLASERGPNSTHRPHYHLIIAWDPSTGVSAEIMHSRIKHYWYSCAETHKGFVTPRYPMGGEVKRSGARILPFEVSTLNDCLKSAFYTAKYVTKDIYFMREIEDKVTRDTFKSREFKRFLPHHRQSKSLGFHGIASLSDAEKIDLLLRGKAFLGSDRLSMPPLYIQNKLLFKPCYILEPLSKMYPQGRRVVRQAYTKFYNDYFGLIFENKVKYYDTLFSMMQDFSYWSTSGVDYSLYKDIPYFIRDNATLEKLGCSLSVAYLAYYGRPYNYCFSDVKLTMLNAHVFPSKSYSSVLIDYVHWCNIQEFFTYLLSHCQWQDSGERDVNEDNVRAYFNQIVSSNVG